MRELGPIGLLDLEGVKVALWVALGVWVVVLFAITGCGRGEE